MSSLPRATATTGTGLLRPESTLLDPPPPSSSVQRPTRPTLFGSLTRPIMGYNNRLTPVPADWLFSRHGVPAMIANCALRLSTTHLAYVPALSTTIITVQLS